MADPVEADCSARRPLKTRGRAWAGALGRFLATHGVNPNGISAAGILVAGFGATAFVLSGRNGATRGAWLLAAAACIQFRLLCNMMDGLVAVEGGRKTPTGDLWNEVPDRLEDTLLLVSAGYAVAGHPWIAALGWAAALAAMATAYIRALGHSLGLPQDFRGPMAKPHRMALLTGAAILASMEPLMRIHDRIIPCALALILAGAFWTVARRLHRASALLRSRA